MSEHPAVPDIAILASFSGEGGVERMLVNLANEFAERNHRVHLLLIKSTSRHLKELHPGVEAISLGSRHTATSLLPLISYLRAHRPARMLVVKDRAGRLAVRARALAGTETRLVLRLGTNLSASLKHRNLFQRWLRLWPIRHAYPKLDHIIAVSKGVADDTISLSGVDATKVSVIRNPVLTPRVRELAQSAAPHPWLKEKTLPVVIGAGRLTFQKDFATLIRALSRLSEKRQLRMIILGEGDQRSALQALIDELGLHDKVDLPGFAENPYAYMARADLFVLSSRWEGSPNVLTEAMLLGVPVVATDCPSGPAEILQNGRIAPLVPMGDWRQLADAMESILTSPPDSALLVDAVKDYTVETSADGYLAALGLGSNTL